MRRRGVSISIAAVAACAALGAGAALAPAAGGPISLVKRTGHLHDFVTSAVGCGSGRTALSGGFSAGSRVISQRSAPTAAGGWQVRLFDNTNPSPPRSFTASALCERSGARRIKRVSREISLAAGKRRTVVAPCPSGWKVLAGGYAVLPPFAGGLTGAIGVDRSNRVSPTEWAVSGTNDQLATTLVAYAICERASMPKVSKVVKQANLAGSGQTTALAKCGPGSHLLGGGFKSRPPEHAGLFPAISTSAPAGTRSWKATYSGPGMHPNGASITSFAYCESN